MRLLEHFVFDFVYTQLGFFWRMSCRFKTKITNVSISVILIFSLKNPKETSKIPLFAHTQMQRILSGSDIQPKYIS